MASRFESCPILEGFKLARLLRPSIKQPDADLRTITIFSESYMVVGEKWLLLKKAPVGLRGNAFHPQIAGLRQ